jgi:hypothetical protein
VTAADFRAGVEAAVALLFGRPGALARFDVSLEGFWRSFAAILLVLPCFAVSVLAEGRIESAGLPAEVADGFPWFGFVAVRTVALLLEWIALPVVLALLAGRLGLAARYVPFIVARNWASAVASALYSAPALLFLAGIAGAAVSQVLSLAIVAVALQYQYRIARQALAVPPGMAVAVVVLDAMLGLVALLTVARLAPA